METKIIDDLSTQKTFEVTVPALATAGYFEDAARNLSQSHSIPGFRPGNAPFNIIVREIGDQKAYQEVVTIALNKLLPEFFTKNKLQVLGEPDIQVIKVAIDNPFVFRVTVALHPEFKLPDISKIKTKKKNVTVTDKEIDSSLEYLKKVRKVNKIDDEFAKTMGKFKNLAELKKSVKEGIKKDKERVEHNNSRARLLEIIGKKINIEVAPLLIKREANAIINQHKEEVVRMGMDWDEYLKKIKKTPDELVENQKELAKSKIINSVILAQIVKDENIKVDNNEIEAEFNNFIASQGSDIAEIQKKLDLGQLRNNIFQKLLHEKVFSNVLDKNIE